MNEKLAGQILWEKMKIIDINKFTNWLEKIPILKDYMPDLS